MSLLDGVTMKIILVSMGSGGGGCLDQTPLAATGKMDCSSYTRAAEAHGLGYSGQIPALKR
jgi:hypothetical protein